MIEIYHIGYTYDPESTLATFVAKEPRELVATRDTREEADEYVQAQATGMTFLFKEVDLSDE
jgi:hypothetical protein